MVHPPVTSMLAEYFSKRRGMANALMFSGASLGNLVFAPIMTALFDSYGYTGTLFVVAGMTLNTCVTGALMRPVNSFKKNRNIKQSENGDIEETESLVLTEKSIHIKLVKGKEFSSLEIIPNTISDIKKENRHFLRMHSFDPSRTSTESPLVSRKRTWSAVVKSDSSTHKTVSEGDHTEHSRHFLESLSHSNMALYTSTAGFCGSVVDIRENMERTLSQTEEPEIGVEQPCFQCKTKTKKVLKMLFDLSLFRNPVFRLFMLMAFMVAPGTGITLILVAPHSKDLGLSSDKIGILLSVIGCFDLFSRVALAIFSDKKFVNRTTILGVSAIILGLTSHLLRFFTTFEAMIVFSVIIGKLQSTVSTYMHPSY